MSKTHKQASLYIKTHDLLQEIIDKGPNDEPGKNSKAKVVHSLVVKHHKKLFGDQNDNSTNSNNDSIND